MHKLRIASKGPGPGQKYAIQARKHIATLRKAPRKQHPDRTITGYDKRIASRFYQFRLATPSPASIWSGPRTGLMLSVDGVTTSGASLQELS